MTQTADPTDVTSAGPSRLVSHNPADGSVIADFPAMTADEVAATVAQARAASVAWSASTFAQRKSVLLRWASYLARHADELAELMHRENGKPVDDAYLEVVLALEHLRWAATHAERKLKPQRVAPGPLMANFSARVEYRPLGVVGVIGPWNYPVYTPSGSIVYALAAGNTVVFKPSEYTTAVGAWFVESFAKANPDVDPAVLSLVSGFGDTGAALCRADIDKIAFTGSTGTGKKIMATCAERLTPVLMECGGKDALIVAEDADVRAAAEAAAFGGLGNAGQTCVGVERVYVVQAVRERFLEALKDELKGVRPGSDEKASYGPMTMPSQIDVVRRHIADAIEHGGTPMLGGLDAVHEPYIDPVVIVDADENSAAVQEETFGPLITVRTVRDVEEAIRLTNATPYGLASTVFSKRRGVEIARQLRVGATSINSPLAFGAIPSLPFGGVGDSGFGRIHGEQGLREFARTHAIARQMYAIPGMALLSFGRPAYLLKVVRKVTTMRHGRGGGA